jgi:hypothetical protein
MNGQEPKRVTLHKLGVWYETDRGVAFRLMAQPARTYDGRHTSQVQFLDQTWDVLLWRPESTRERPGWFVRLLERVWKTRLSSRMVCRLPEAAPAAQGLA